MVNPINQKEFAVFAKKLVQVFSERILMQYLPSWETILFSAMKNAIIVTKDLSKSWSKTLMIIMLLQEVWIHV